MQMVLKGDYFNSKFSHPEGLGHLSAAQETIIKTCPGEINIELWRAGVFYEHVEKVIDSASKGFDSWRKLSFEQRVQYLKKYLLHAP